MVIENAQNSPNGAPGLAGSLYGSCPMRGTPGEINGNDATTWPGTSIYFDALGENQGSMRLRGAPSGSGGVRFESTLGVPSAPFLFCIAMGRADIPLNLLVTFGGPWSCSLLLDPFTLSFNDAFSFDVNGEHRLTVDISGDPALVGLTFDFEWIVYDPALVDFRASNGLEFTVVE
jgi:hypothetical protein